MLMQNKRHGALCLCTTAAIGLFTSFANAGGVSPVGPFTGDISESWESFDNYLVDPDFNMDEPTVCFGGGAQISGGGQMVIYEPGAANFGLATPGSAQVVDGVKGHGINTGPDGTASIVFDPPVCSFGGYWGAAELDGTYDGLVDFAFLDADGNVIGTATFDYVDDGDGIGDLQWAGWESTTPIAQVNYRGDFVVNDYLQGTYGDCGDGGPEKCKGDGNGDGFVDVNDLLGLLAAWGPCSSGVCEFGFVCGGEIPWCNDAQTCACFTMIEGGIDCFAAGGCDIFCSSSADCPEGARCCIDTCCGDPVCAFLCTDIDPGNGNGVNSDMLGLSGSNMNVAQAIKDLPSGNAPTPVDFGNPDCPYDFNGDGFVDVNDLLSLLANWGPCPVEPVDCEVGFTCGDDLVICDELNGILCGCFTHFSGQPVCAANSSCSNPPCPNGQSDCPDGYLCIIDSCCSDNVCLEDCGGNQLEDCEVGFTCGDTLTPCPVDPVNCVCVTNWDGTPECVDISDGSSCTQFVTCNNGPDACPAGTACIINTCCADSICIPLCGGSSCDVGFTCGDTLTPCPEGGDNCWCWTAFDGSFVCGQDGSCSSFAVCPNGQSDCPSGTNCVIDTCCGDPVCLPECGGMQSECEVGFVCGGDITMCGSEGQCFCFTSFDGSPACVFDRACVDLPTCPNGDCPTGYTCCIDTCCGEPICFEDCEGLNPGSGVQPAIGDATGVGIYEGRAGSQK